MQKIKVSKDTVVYNKKENLNDDCDMADALTGYIFKEEGSIVIGSKKNYLLYRGKNYDEMGYCYSLNSAMNIIRTEFAKQMQKDQKYEIHIKEPSDKEYKIYLYHYSTGYIYNGLSLVDKFKVREIPKVERREAPALDFLITKSSEKTRNSEKTERKISGTSNTKKEKRHREKKIKTN